MPAPPLWDEVIHGGDGGATVAIVVVPRSAKTTLDGVVNGAVCIRVAAPPVDGKANDALLRFLARVTGAPRGCIGIEAGASSRRKRLRFDGVSPEALAEALAAYQGRSGGV